MVASERGRGCGLDWLDRLFRRSFTDCFQTASGQFERVASSHVVAAPNRHSSLCPDFSDKAELD